MLLNILSYVSFVPSAGKLISILTVKPTSFGCPEPVEPERLGGCVSLDFTVCFLPSLFALGAFFILPVLLAGNSP